MSFKAGPCLSSVGSLAQRPWHTLRTQCVFVEWVRVGQKSDWSRKASSKVSTRAPGQDERVRSQLGIAPVCPQVSEADRAVSVRPREPVWTVRQAGNQQPTDKAGQHGQQEKGQGLGSRTWASGGG